MNSEIQEPTYVSIMLANGKEHPLQVIVEPDGWTFPIGVRQSGKVIVKVDGRHHFILHEYVDRENYDLIVWLPATTEELWVYLDNEKLHSWSSEALPQEVRASLNLT